MEIISVGHYLLKKVSLDDIRFLRISTGHGDVYDKK
jgi:hypothetical protein